MNGREIRKGATDVIENYVKQNGGEFPAAIRHEIESISKQGGTPLVVTAFNFGADDYLTKPFGVGELHARVRVALRHAARAPDAQGTEPAKFAVGDPHVDLLARRVVVREQEVRLTRLEYKLLAVLVRYAGKVLTHDFLLGEVWGPRAAGETHYLRVYMANLRRKLEVDPAQPRYRITEQGVGYRFADE